MDMEQKATNEARKLIMGAEARKALDEALDKELPVLMFIDQGEHTKVIGIEMNMNLQMVVAGHKMLMKNLASLAND